MAVSDSFLTFVLAQLSALDDVWSKRMFGGVGLYRGDTFFAVMDNQALFFKVDETTAPRYRAEGMPPFAPIPGKPAMLTYYQVPAGIIEDPDALADWARQSIAVAGRSPKAKAQSAKASAKTSVKPGSRKAATKKTSATKTSAKKTSGKKTSMNRTSPKPKAAPKKRSATRKAPQRATKPKRPARPRRRR
jgi:DNA transformation protein